MDVSRSIHKIWRKWNSRWSVYQKISEFDGELEQYQYLTVYIMLLFQLIENKNEIINAEKPDMRKINFYVICLISFIQLISYEFKRLKHLSCFWYTKILSQMSSMCKSNERVHRQIIIIALQTARATARSKKIFDTRVCVILPTFSTSVIWSTGSR